MTAFRPMPAAARRTVLSLIALVALPVAVAAQSLPTAEELLERHIEAIGGRDAVLAARSTHSRGRFSMPAAGISGALDVYQAEPNLSYTRVEIPALGEIRTGFNGEVGWSINPMEGPRLIEGMELAALKDESGVESTMRGPKYVESMETVERTSMNGEDCYKVKVVWRSGRESYDCYSVDTGLIVGMELRSESPMGTIDVTVLLSDYKPFGNVRMPTRMTQQMMGQEQVMTINEVEFDTVDPAVFELPTEIKALVAK